MVSLTTLLPQVYFRFRQISGRYVKIGRLDEHGFRTSAHASVVAAELAEEVAVAEAVAARGSQNGHQRMFLSAC